MPTKKSNLLATAALAAMMPLSGAHMIMKNPVPFNAPNNSPLVPDGSDFPCKGPPSGSAQVNEWPAGSTQSLTFSGTAVHGGGSCQISVTSDKTPTKDSKWKVIYSIEGGCPANVEGNLNTNGPSYDGTFPFTVPQDLPTGDMTVAWTWFNKIGNREMYMNCASVSVTGGADNASGLDALPDMAIANVNVPGSCGTTKEGADYTFANPGMFGTTVGDGPFMGLCAGAPSQPGMGRSSSSGGGGGGGGGSGSDGAAGSSSQAPVASDAGSAMPPTFRTIKTVTASMPPVPSNPGDVMAPSACSAAPAPKPTPAQPSQHPSTAYPTAAPAPAPAQSPVTPCPSAGPAPGSGSSSGTPCSIDGQLVCSPDGTQFGLCNFGKAVMMAVAGGTKCVNGAIAKRGDYTHRNQRTTV